MGTNCAMTGTVRLGWRPAIHPPQVERKSIGPVEASATTLIGAVEPVI